MNYGISQTRLGRILKLVGDVKGKRILDLGCSTGYLGEIFKRSGAYVVGADISSQAVQKAKEVLDEAYDFDIEGEWPEEIRKENFDIIILAEIVEHVFNPVHVLKKARGLLSEGGYIIISTPNFLSWMNRLKFLFGRFKYQEEGIFDFGHIRWFTWKLLNKNLSDSGFKIVKSANIIFPGKLTKVLKVWPSLFANQFVIKAVKDDLKPGI